MAAVPFTTILCGVLGVLPPKNILKDKTCSRDFDLRAQRCIIYQVIDDYLDVGSQRIVVKGTAGHLFRYRELDDDISMTSICAFS